MSDFIFPADRFPCFQPASGEGLNLTTEKFGPSLTFDPLSDVYARSGIKFEQDGYQFIPEGDALKSELMEVLYNVVDDVYTRPRYGSNSGNFHRKGWKNGVWRYCNIEKKVERDWNMGYLARQGLSIDGEGNTLDAFLDFRFNHLAAGKKVRTLTMRLPSTTFRDGKVRVLVCCADDYTVLLDTQQTSQIFRAQGWNDFVIRVELSGVRGDHQYEGNSYQNAQIFRQPLHRPLHNPQWYNPFRVLIEMENEDKP